MTIYNIITHIYIYYIIYTYQSQSICDSPRNKRLASETSRNATLSRPDEWSFGSGDAQQRKAKAVVLPATGQNGWVYGEKMLDVRI